MKPSRGRSRRCRTSADAALAKAAAEGLPDRIEVVEWVERAKRLVLMERDRSALRSALPHLMDQLYRLMEGLTLRDDVSREFVIEKLLERLPAIRTRLSEDVEAAYEGDPAAKSYAEIVVSYPSIRAIAIYRIAHELHAARPAGPAADDDRARARSHRDRHPPRREDRTPVLHRPRNRRGDRRDHGDRRQRSAVPGGHPGREVPAPRRDPARQEAPPHHRGRRHDLRRRDDPRRRDDHR